MPRRGGAASRCYKSLRRIIRLRGAVTTVDDKPEPTDSAEQASNTLLTLKAMNLLEKKVANLSLDFDSKFIALTRDINAARENERQMFVSRQNDLQSENLLLKQENEALKERIATLIVACYVGFKHQSKRLRERES